MKQKVQILENETVLYQGKLQDLPFKEDHIVQKSIDLFDDEDPCIIHQSYVIKEFADQILSVIKDKQLVEFKNHKTVFSCLPYNIETTTIKLLG